MSLITEAKKGNITQEMEQVADDEGVEPEFVRRGIASGRIVIPLSPYRYTKPCGIGKEIGRAHV
jgi:phosphomethylpyrimidine synthase